jgi:hypothetical protein
MMSESGLRSTPDYRQEIVGSLTPVRPLPSPARRVWMLVPLGLLLSITAPLLAGQRGDLGAYAPLVTWGLTGLQSLLGLWLLALGLREAVPGQNVSWRALAFAAVLTALLVGGVTVMTNTASATIVPPGREWQYWAECVAWPLAIGAPFMLIATLMAVRAFPTRPAIAGALCGMSAGVLSDAGWRLSCWISEPIHIVGSHGLAMLGLAAAGSILAIFADFSRWKRLRSRT